MYTEKCVNFYLNNAEQKTVLCRMLEIVYEKNSEQSHLMQEIDFNNAVSRFEYTVNVMCRVQILLMWKQILTMQKNRFNDCEIQILKSTQIKLLNLEKRDFTRCFMRK